MLYGRRILENEEFRKKEVSEQKEYGDDSRLGYCA